MKTGNTSRRTFLKLAGATGIVAGSASSLFGSNGTEYLLDAETEPQQAYSANDKIHLGLIGAGGQGMGDTETALRAAGGGAEIVAVADLYDGRLARSKELWGDKLFTTRDHREILARSDVDAVIIATPDHWHRQITIEALQAGKDVYVEKPMVQDLSEGHAVIEAAQKANRILQVGSQRVSSILYKKAKDLLAAGAIGQLNMIEAWYNRNSAMGAWQYSIPPDASPQTVDWDRFLGHAPKRPFDATRFFRWRNYRDYGTGVAGDLFVHLFSGMHFITDSNGPSRAMSTGGLRYWNDGRDVPDVMIGLYDYAKSAAHPAFNLLVQVNFVDGSGGSQGFRFIGDEGVLTLGNNITVTNAPRAKEPGYSIDTFPKAVQEEFVKEYRKQYPPQGTRISGEKSETYSVSRNYSDHIDHFKVFFDAMRSRKPVIEDAVFGFRAAGAALLANVSYFEGRPVEWDPIKMKLKK